MPVLMILNLWKSFLRDTDFLIILRVTNENLSNFKISYEYIKKVKRKLII